MTRKRTAGFCSHTLQGPRVLVFLGFSRSFVLTAVALSRAGVHINFSGLIASSFKGFTPGRAAELFRLLLQVSVASSSRINFQTTNTHSNRRGTGELRLQKFDCQASKHL